MRVVLGIVGALAGLAVEGRGDQWFFIAFGGAVGFALGWLSELTSRLNELAARRPDAVASPPQVRPATTEPRPAPVAAPVPAQTVPASAQGTPAFMHSPPPQAERAARDPEWWRPAVRWLLAGNVPVKVGVLVSFFGVAFLLKYAADNDFLRVPPAVRLFMVAAIGVAVGAFGWTLRERMRTYALALQGGAVGILYLTVYAALRLYGLMPAVAAFALLVAIALGAGVLAYAQRAQALAVLGSVGGFLAPLLASTGEGSHVALFGYYFVLNLAIFGLAWFTAWRPLNLIGFGFTFVVGTIWGVEYYRPEHYATTQPFLIAFFLIYTGIAALYSLRQAPRLRGLVDATLVFGTPVLAMPLQVALLRGSEYGVGHSMVAASLVYFALAYGLHRAGPPTARLLVEAFAALCIAFATMAIPQYFDAHWTAAAWALEGAAMVWVGVRQARIPLRVAGAVLVFAGGFAHLVAGGPDDVVILNADFVAGLFVAAAAFIAASQLGTAALQRARHEPGLRIALFAWAVAWWLGVGLDEIHDFVPEPYRFDAVLVYLAAGAALGAAWARRSRQALFGFGTRALLPVALALLVGSVVSADATHPFADVGAIAWSAVLAAHAYGVAWTMDGDERELWWGAGLWLVAGLLAAEADWGVGDALRASDAWRAFAVTAACVGTAAAAVHVGRLRGSDEWLRVGALPVLGFALAYLALQCLAHGGGVASFYLPVLNPMDAAAVGLLWFGTRWAWPVVRGPAAGYAIAFAAWWFLTFAVVRAVHQLAGMPYEFDAAFSSMLLQAALSLTWGLAALVAMVVGARRGERAVWLVGGGLMAVVVAKLFVLDLGNSGTVERIVSFIGVGALLLVVGYLAPVPSRRVGSELA